MSHLEVPRFPRGFLFAAKPVSPPPTFVAGPLLPNFWVHPWTNVETAGTLDLFVVIIGHAVPTRPDQGSAAAAALLSALEEGEGAFFQAVSDYSGRHAIIFGSSGNLSVVNDATGMRSVFYAVGGGVVASHPQLVERALGGPIVRNDLPFRYGYPGNRTPFDRVRVLIPNTYYWMTANVIRRFWPVVAPAPRTAGEAAAFLLDTSAHAFKVMAAGRPVRVSLTAGLDSRAVFAVALRAGIEFETYTYGGGRATEVDQRAAVDLSGQYGIKHTAIQHRVADPVLEDRLEESHYSLHHGQWVGSLRQYFPGPESLAVIGNLLEIGRSNYGPARAKGLVAPSDAETMVEAHRRKMGDTVLRRVKRYGVERFHQESLAAFRGFTDDTGLDIVAGMLDPFDHFYWEHRMGTWQGVAMGERDFYAEPFIPFNARTVFEVMLGVPSLERYADSTVLQMIEMVDPELLELPVNPKRWPEKVTAGTPR